MMHNITNNHNDKEHLITQIASLELRRQHLHYYAVEDLEYAKYTSNSENIDKIIAEKEQRIAALAQYPLEDLEDIYKELLERFNHEHHLNHILRGTINYDLWLKMDSWSIDEGIAIVLGKDPQLIHWNHIKLWKNSYFVQAYQYIREVAYRARESQIIYDGNSPERFLNWFVNKGFIISEEIREYMNKFDNSKLDPLSDSHHPNFSNKLYAANKTHAYLIQHPEAYKGKSVKQAALDYLKKNAKEFGLTIGEGDKVNKHAIEEIAKVANWQTKGGAPET